MLEKLRELVLKLWKSDGLSQALELIILKIMLAE